MKKILYIFFAFACLSVLGNCTSITESAGRALDGSAFQEKKLALYRRQQKKDPAKPDISICLLQNRNGGRSVAITLDRYPAITLRCSAPDGEGLIYFMSLEYLGGGVSGWNEYTLELSGTGKLELNADEAVLWVPVFPDPVQISTGRLRRYDTRITGGEALIILRNRRERILALTEWMKEHENIPVLQNQETFADYWKPLVLPEKTAKQKRPALWQQEGDIFERAESIRWNVSYSQRVFPEALRPVRNSGTLLRDWEEALNWIYLEYQWEYLTELFAGEITVPLKK